MARSRNTRTLGTILQKIGRALSGGSSSSGTGGRTTNRQPRRRTQTSGKGLLRRLLG